MSSRLRNSLQQRPVRLDDPAIVAELASQNERKNWAASRFGLPAIGSKLVNRHGIEWVVQCHAEVPTSDSLHRWREGKVEAQNDLYPVVAPMNLSPKLMEFFNTIDRCTTKKFAILDTMPGRRNDGHVPGGNSIDTLSHPNTNLLFLDAARVNEAVIAHEFGHAWIQYVDECEDLRTLEDPTNPQRLRQVGYIQSFVLDLKVNDLLRSKGFDMKPIEDDQAHSMAQLAAALESGYRPENPREEVFMALLVADQIVQRQNGRLNDLVRFDRSLASICFSLAPLVNLAEVLAESVARHGYGSRDALIRCIDECLLASFSRTDEAFDLHDKLTEVSPEEPNLDKFPNWLPAIPPKLKCKVGKHMARNDVGLDWAYSVAPTPAGKTKVAFQSPDGDRTSEVLVDHRIGPQTPYSGMSELWAEMLELKRQNEERRNRMDQGIHKPTGMPQSGEKNRTDRTATVSVQPQDSIPKLPGRPYMAGLGRFLTAARIIEQLGGEQPYMYAYSNPITYTDPSGLKSKKLYTRFITPFGCSAGYQCPAPKRSWFGNCLEWITGTDKADHGHYCRACADACIAACCTDADSGGDLFCVAVCYGRELNCLDDGIY